MLRRIDWKKTRIDEYDSESESDSDESETEGDKRTKKKPNSCEMVWYGQVAKRSFKGFKVREGEEEGYCERGRGREKGQCGLMC